MLKLERFLNLVPIRLPHSFLLVASLLRKKYFLTFHSFLFILGLTSREKTDLIIFIPCSSSSFSASFQMKVCWQSVVFLMPTKPTKRPKTISVSIHLSVLSGFPSDHINVSACDHICFISGIDGWQSSTWARPGNFGLILAFQNHRPALEQVMFDIRDQEISGMWKIVSAFLGGPSDLSAQIVGGLFHGCLSLMSTCWL